MRGRRAAQQINVTISLVDKDAVHIHFTEGRRTVQRRSVDALIRQKRNFGTVARTVCWLTIMLLHAGCGLVIPTPTPQGSNIRTFGVA